MTTTSARPGTALASWHDGPAKAAILEFVAHVADRVAPEDRVAVFDNDGTLWCEKPMPIQLDFILRRFVEMAAADPSLRERQPWMAARWSSSSSIGAARSDRFLRDTRHPPELDYLDDGPEKPVRIWNRTGRRPLLAAGNSNGDVPMLHFTQHTDKPSLRLLVVHDDQEREFAYTAGADQALEQAAQDGWTLISVKDDWATVF